MEGPAFSTRAESLMHRLWGGDLIGMTAMPEAKLAREAEIAYALIALVTDYDCWKKPATGSGDCSSLRPLIPGRFTQGDHCQSPGRIGQCRGPDSPGFAANCRQSRGFDGLARA